MGYILLHGIFSPFLLLLRYLGRSASQKKLVIQTAKIGDCLNSTPLLSALDNFDLVCERSCLDVIASFPGVGDIFIVSDYKKLGLYGKISLALELFGNRYSAAYVLQPNAFNLFLAEMSYPGDRVGIDIDYKKNYINNRFCSRNRCIKHGKNDLVLNTYLKMLSIPPINREKYYYGFKRPESELVKLVNSDLFLVGISLSAGNKMKSLPDELSCGLLKILGEYKGVKIIFFGVEGEERYLRAVEERGCLNTVDYINLIGKLDLGETAWLLRKISLYMSSDTGLSYLADTIEIPLINFMGPCSYNEQRPLWNKALVVKTPGLEPFSFIFDAPYSSTLSNNELYKMDRESMESVENFIGEIYRESQSR